MDDLMFLIAELQRRQSNLIQIGTVAAVDHETQRVKLSVGGVLTDWRPWSSGRAGAVRSWSPPTLGEQVNYFSPCGDLDQGVAMGAHYQDAHPAPANSGDVERHDYPDGSYIEYNHATHTLLVNLGNGKSIITGHAKFIGSLEVDGDFKASGGAFTHNDVNVGDDHAHDKTQPGAGNTGKPI